MNYKNKLGVMLCLNGLMTALPAHAQIGAMGITNDGLKFPDGSVQTTAATTSATITEYRIVGLTVTTTDGTAEATVGNSNDTVTGYSAMDILCENEFGSASRVAFTNEQLAPSVSPFTDKGWIRPINIELFYNPDATQGNPWFAYDTAVGAIGFSESSQTLAVDNLNCNDFASTAVAGLTISPNLGTFEIRLCTNFHRIACAAPVQITSAP